MGFAEMGFEKVYFEDMEFEDCRARNYVLPHRERRQGWCSGSQRPCTHTLYLRDSSSQAPAAPLARGSGSSETTTQGLTEVRGGTRVRAELQPSYRSVSSSSNWVGMYARSRLTCVYVVVGPSRMFPAGERGCPCGERRRVLLPPVPVEIAESGCRRGGHILKGEPRRRAPFPPRWPRKPWVGGGPARRAAHP